MFGLSENAKRFLTPLKILQLHNHRHTLEIQSIHPRSKPYRMCEILSKTILIPKHLNRIPTRIGTSVEVRGKILISVEFLHRENVFGVIGGSSSTDGDEHYVDYLSLGVVIKEPDSLAEFSGEVGEKGKFWVVISGRLRVIGFCRGTQSVLSMMRS